MGKIYVRERGNVGRGAGRPRFTIVAISGLDLKVYHSHIRKAELDKLAEDLKAEIVYLPRGEKVGDEGQESGHGRGHRHHRNQGEHQD